MDAATSRRILVVEDDPDIGRLVALQLGELGCECRLVADGLLALEQALAGRWDLVILDVMLPRMDGLEICRRLRAAQSTTPVLMLTAKSSELDRVLGLELGADDYLIKPFAFSELLARVGALLRRGTASAVQPATALRLGDLEVDLISRKAHRAGERLDLTAKEFNLLSLLLRRRGQILSRTTLAEQVWDMNFDSDTNVVEVAVRRLRAKLDDPFPAKLLHTVRGMGYVLEERAS